MYLSGRSHTLVRDYINTAKHVEISFLWPVIVKHFADNNYYFQDDIAPVYSIT